MSSPDSAQVADRPGGTHNREPHMIALGIDPGGKKGVAWAVYDDEADHLTVGMEKPCPGEEAVHSAHRIADRLIADYSVWVLGIEVQHIPRLPQSAMPGDRTKALGIIYAQAAAALKLAEVVGACKAAAHYNGTKVVDLQPATIKQAITGKGNASKEQVRKMVLALFGARMTLVRNPREKKVLREDEADASAAAIASLRRAT